jgi:large subunit ribosomal protein L10
MNKIEKQQIVAELVETFNNNPFVYLADTDGLTAGDTNAFRRLLFENGVSMRMVKNTLVKKAMDESDKDFGDLVSVLKGTTCVMFAENVKAPAKTIKKFREKSDKPLLKGAWIDSSVYIGDDQLVNLINLKSKEDLIGDIIHLLQSPAKNVIGGLQSNAGQKIAGLVKALSER